MQFSYFKWNVKQWYFELPLCKNLRHILSICLLLSFYFAFLRGLGNHGDWIIGCDCVMSPLKAETAVSEVFKYDHVQVDGIKHYMELSDCSVISKLFAKLKKSYLIFSFFEVLAIPMVT